MLGLRFLSQSTLLGISCPCVLEIKHCFVFVFQCIVFTPGLVTGPIQYLDFRFWPGHWILTWLSGRPSQFFFKKSKRCCFNIKKKVNGLQLGFVESTGRVTLGFFFPYFFFNPGRLGSGPDRVLKLYFDELRFLNWSYRWNHALTYGLGWQNPIGMW